MNTKENNDELQCNQKNHRQQRALLTCHRMQPIKKKEKRQQAWPGHHCFIRQCNRTKRRRRP